MKKDNIIWWLINIIVFIILVLFLSRCQKVHTLSDIDIFNIDLNAMKDNCIVNNQGVIIDDDNGNYLYQHDLDIFKNNIFKDKIAPGITGSYLFNVHTNTNIKYSIVMDKISKYDINLKYRLKKNNEYIIDKWVKVDKLNTKEFILNKDETDKYILEWKWFDDDLDSFIGENMDKYLLNINFYLEGVDS